MTTEQSLSWHYERRIEDSKWGDGLPRAIDYFTRDDGVEISGNETSRETWVFTYRRQHIELEFAIFARYVPPGTVENEKELLRHSRGLGPICSVSPGIWRLRQPLTERDAAIIAMDVRDFVLHFHEFGVLTSTPIRPVKKLHFHTDIFSRFSDN